MEYKRYKTKIIVEIESDNVLNLVWVERRFRNWVNSRTEGFSVKVPIEPEWEEIPRPAEGHG